MQDARPQHEDLAGQCPRCLRYGVVGVTCARPGCVEAEMHFIPAAHVHADDPTHDGLIGRVLDRYLIVGIIGHGGFGRVYRALEMPLGMRVALKVANLEGAAPDEVPLLLARFEAEACALAELNHPNIVRLLRYGTWGARPYLVMELVPGDRTLERLLLELAQKPRALSRRDIGLILFPLLDALGAAHAQGLIHRDVKPENIMLQPMPSGPPLLRLLDFGLARSLSSSNARSRPMGTPLYMAPEQLTRGPLGPWTDLYAVGVIAYELIFGARPFRGPTERLWGQKLDLGLDPLAEAPSAPAEIAAFLRRALAANPADRFRDTEAMREALAMALAAWDGDDQACRLAGPTREVGVDSRGRLMRWQGSLTADARPAPPDAPATAQGPRPRGLPTREARPGARPVERSPAPDPPEAEPARPLEAPPAGAAPPSPAAPAPEAWATLLDEDELAWFAGASGADDEDAPSPPAGDTGASAAEPLLGAEAPPSAGPRPLRRRSEPSLAATAAPTAAGGPDDAVAAADDALAATDDEDEPSLWAPRRGRRTVVLSSLALAAALLLAALGSAAAPAEVRIAGRALASAAPVAQPPAVVEAQAAAARAAHTALIGRASTCTASADELGALAAHCAGEPGCRVLDGPGAARRQSRVSLREPLEPGQSVVLLLQAPASATACGARYQRTTAWTDGAWDVLPAEVGAYSQPQVVVDVRGQQRQRVALAERATSRRKAEEVRALLSRGVATCLRAEDLGAGSAALEVQGHEDVRFYDRDRGFTDERGTSPCELEVRQVLVVSPAAS